MFKFKGEEVDLISSSMRKITPSAIKKLTQSRVQITLAPGQERESNVLAMDENPNALDFRCGSQGRAGAGTFT
jgi:DNA polymerase/3'-5' exonuclease PolX